MSTSDDLIGQNLTTLRGDMSQKDLALKMRDRGWKWSQATVWSVESGERPLRLAEATDIAEILRTQLRMLTGTSSSVELELALREAEAAEQSLRADVYRHHRAKVVLAITADRIMSGGGTLPFSGVPVEQHLRITPEEIVKLMRKRQERLDEENSALSAEAKSRSEEIHESLESQGASFTRTPKPDSPFLRLYKEVNAQHVEHPEAS